MAAEAKTNAGSKLYTCATPKNADLTETEFANLTFVQVKKVGSIGERGINTNIVRYDTLDTLVALKGKGITNAGDTQVEVAEDLTDPGQVALRAAGAPGVPDSYAFKIERADGSLEFLRGLCHRPASSSNKLLLGAAASLAKGTAELEPSRPC